MLWCASPCCIILHAIVMCGKIKLGINQVKVPWLKNFQSCLAFDGSIEKYCYFREFLLLKLGYSWWCHSLVSQFYSNHRSSLSIGCLKSWWCLGRISSLIFNFFWKSSDVLFCAALLLVIFFTKKKKSWQVLFSLLFLLLIRFGGNWKGQSKFK